MAGHGYVASETDNGIDPLSRHTAGEGGIESERTGSAAPASHASETATTSKSQQTKSKEQEPATQGDRRTES